MNIVPQILRNAVSGIFPVLFLSMTILSISVCRASENEDPLTESFLSALEGPTSTAQVADFAKLCAEKEDLGVSALRQLKAVSGTQPLADALAAETIWKLFTMKKWNDGLCELASEILDSPDPAAVAYADWALSIRTGWENSSEIVPWSEELAEKPNWFAKWLAFPAERFAELDYWRVAGNYSVHHSLEALRSSTQKFMARTDGLLREILNSEKTTPEKRRELETYRADADAVLQQIMQTEDMLTARQLYVKFRLATRKIVMANPDLDFQEILFTKRHSAHGLRNITGSQYPWTHKPGGDLCVKRGFDPKDPVRGLLDGRLGPGHVHGTDLHWDGKRIVFGYAQQPVWPLPKPTHTGSLSFVRKLRRSIFTRSPSTAADCVRSPTTRTGATLNRRMPPTVRSFLRRTALQEVVNAEISAQTTPSLISSGARRTEAGSECSATIKTSTATRGHSPTG